MKNEEKTKKQHPVLAAIALFFLILFSALLLFDSCSKSDDAKNKTNEVNGYTIPFGTLLDANPHGGQNGNTLVIKAKITPLLSNKRTIEQNFLNVEDIIKSQDGSKFEVIDYWAVADMEDGSESKVISFMVNTVAIFGISHETIPANKIVNYVDDLWILPSLLKED